MTNHRDPASSHQHPAPPILTFAHKNLRRCHVVLPDTPDPIGAIVYEGRFYAYVKFFPTADAAQRGAKRMMDKGNKILLTRVPKGLVLWVHEPEARLVRKVVD